jgi:hypothetical protein
MARIRSVKPEFFQDRKLARQLTRDERLFYQGLWCQADEHGRAQGDPRLLKGQIFPFDDDITDEAVETMLKTLESAGRIERYDVDGDPYLFLPRLGRHQRLETAKVAPKYPAPPSHPDRSAPDPDESAPRADESARDSDSSALLYGAGSREQGAGQPRADESAQRPTFADFYAGYPRKEARRAAEKAWTSATKRADPQAIVDGLRRHRFSPDKRYIPLPATWLNADRWADGQSTTAPPGQSPEPTFTRAELEEILGPDSWQVPEPPPELDPETDFAAYRAWCQQQTDAHRAQRVRQAIAQRDRSG